MKHSDGQYVDGDSHVDTAEGFFSLLKRGINGTSITSARAILGAT